MQMMLAIFLSLMSVKSWGLELVQNSLILTHTSRHYQTGAETISATQDLIRKSSGPVIALAQEPIAQDRDWYGDPLEKIRYEFFSHGGEHTLSFPKSGDRFEVMAVGGYLSACLGRTLSTLVGNFIADSGSMKQLVIHLPMKAIFTGYVEKSHQLVPQTPYLESILDSSMDGLNLDQVLTRIPVRHWTPFMAESIDISIFQKSTMTSVSKDRFFLEAQIDHQVVFRTGNEKASKKITLDFIH